MTLPDSDGRAGKAATGGFTLPELLVALVVVTLLLLTGLLVALKVEPLTREARTVEWAKRVARGLRSFASSHDGLFPDVAHHPEHARLRQGIDRTARPIKLGNDSATDNFSAVIGGGFYNEEIVYHLEGEHYAPDAPCPPPDRDPSTPILPENIAWAYVRGLGKTADGQTPLLMTRNEKSDTGLRWPLAKERVGGVLEGKIVVAFVDGSSRLIPLDADGIARDDQGRDITVPAPESPYLYGKTMRILQP